MGNARCWLGLTGVLALALALPAARAGVRVELVHTDGVGTNGASVSRRTLYFQGDQSRSVSTVTFTSAKMRDRLKREGRGNPSTLVIIDRVSDNREFSLNPGTNTYNESPLYSPSYVHLKSSKPASSTRTKPSSQSWLRITEMKSEVEPTGQSKVINGFPAHLYRFVAQEEAEDSRTGRIVRSQLIKELWNSTDPRVMAAYRSYMNYNRALAKLYHTTLSVDSIQQLPMVEMPFTFGENDKPEEPDPFSKLPGFPVEVSSRWVVTCLSHCLAGDRGDLRKSEAGETGVDRAPTRSAHRVPQTGSVTNVMWSMHTEILAIHTGKLPASLFEVPADYKKE